MENELNQNALFVYSVQFSLSMRRHSNSMRVEQRSSFFCICLIGLINAWLFRRVTHKRLDQRLLCAIGPLSRKSVSHYCIHYFIFSSLSIANDTGNFIYGFPIFIHLSRFLCINQLIKLFFRIYWIVWRNMIILNWCIG